MSVALSLSLSLILCCRCATPAPAQPFAGEPLIVACAACGRADARRACGRCRKERYCSPACQRGAWAGHKASCAAPAAPLLASRALLVALSVDLARALPERTVEGNARFLWLACRAAADAERKCMDLALAGMGVTSSCDAGAVCSTAAMVFNQMAGSAAAADAAAKGAQTQALAALFSLERTARGEGHVDVGMPLGVERAAQDAHKEVCMVLDEISDGQPEGALESMTLVQGVASWLQKSSKAHWRGDPRSIPPNRPAHRSEAKHHEDTFVAGAEQRCTYDPAALPVGAQLSALHFSQGLFFRRVDCEALVDGWVPQRVMGFVPVPAVIELAPLREAIDAKKAAKEPDEQTVKE